MKMEGTWRTTRTGNERRTSRQEAIKSGREKDGEEKRET